MKPGDMIKIKATGGASVALWNIREWQLDGSGAKVVGWVKPNNHCIVLALTEPVMWKSKQALILCGMKLGWQSISFFETLL